MSATTSTTASRVFSALIGVTAFGVLLQGITAGIFMALRGTDAREGWVTAHAFIADATALVAVVTAVVALVAIRRSRPGLAWATLVLALLLIAQTVIGHTMAATDLPWLVAVHVPLALIVFGVTIWLSVRATRREMSRLPA